MPRYIKVEDALNAMCDSCDAKHAICAHYPCKHYEAVEHTPSADVVEVVRCKDCKHLEILNGKSVFARCNLHDFPFISFGKIDTRTWFCPDGERREDVGNC